MRQLIASIRSLFGRTFGSRGFTFQRPQEHRWTVASNKSGDPFTIVRLAENQLARRESLPIELQVIVPSDEIDLSSSEGHEKREELERFEDRLSRLCEKDGCLLVAVVTLTDERSFLLYASDSSAAKQRLRILREEFPSLRFTYSIGDSKDWATYRDYATRIGGRIGRRTA